MSRHVRNQRVTEALESFLRETHADQGGEATFEEWLEATTWDITEGFNCEAVCLNRSYGGEYHERTET